MSKRYLLVKVVSEHSLTRELFEMEVTSSVRRLFGEFGLARIAPRVLRFDVPRSEAIVSCNKEGAEDLQTAIGLSSGPSETAVLALTIRVSGTIRGLRRKQHF
jgi:RNase P/RNase MRP subunit POP5